eukprot:TRINITY_DN11516_c0_g1_i1.p1 TRINITY_DN11516_c0_g1~~TRINITY_DN11516_c0_g1_i1.p1  ORF type:complete len:159 (+),score=29.34 TRINITY_DN11516_c0_g1_i1:42-479(+)
MKVVIAVVFFLYVCFAGKLNYPSCKTGVVSRVDEEHIEINFGDNGDCESCHSELQSHSDGIVAFNECQDSLVIVKEIGAPQDHCCLVWDNLKCAVILEQCYGPCTQGAIQCIDCFQNMWGTCCCCVQNDLHGIVPVAINCTTCCV